MSDRQQVTTQQIAEFALNPLALGAETVDAVKRIILDTATCAIGGQGTDIGQVLSGLYTDIGGAGESRALVTGQRLPMSSAAALNAHLANILDSDETLLNFAHFASVIVMPALSIGESMGSTGSELLEAVAVGFDVASRLGLAIPAFSFTPEGEISRRTRNGFSWAAFGTVAAAGRLLGLTTEQMRHAFGAVYAMTPVHGCMEPFAASIGRSEVPWHKYGMYSAIAEAGVRAALLAQRGFRADASLLDEPSEFWRAFTAEEFNWDVVADRLGSRWYIEETAIKPYPFCRYGNPMFDLFVQLKAEHSLTADEIEDIEFTVVPYDSIIGFVDMPVARTTLETMFCVPHAVAMLALDIPAGPEWSKPERLDAPEVNAVAKLVRSAVEPSWGPLLEQQVREHGRWQRMPVKLTVTARGESYVATTDTAKGDPGPNTRLTDDELRAKAHRFADEGITPERVDGFISAVGQLERIPNAAALTELLTSPN